MNAARTNLVSRVSHARPAYKLRMWVGGMEFVSDQSIDTLERAQERARYMAWCDNIDVDVVSYHTGLRCLTDHVVQTFAPHDYELAVECGD